MSISKVTRAAKRAEVIKALAHPSRLLIADALLNEERCVADLTEMIGADVSTVSKHLGVMHAAGLVRLEKRGQYVYYRMACPCLEEFLGCVDQITSTRPKCCGIRC